MTKVPLLKKKTITTNYPLPMAEEMKRELRELKSVHGVNVNEWLRGLVRDGMPKLRKAMKSA